MNAEVMGAFDLGKVATATANAGAQALTGSFVQAAGTLISGLFSSGPSPWDSAGDGVHDWFTKYGDQAFLDWMRNKHSDSFGNLDQVKALRVLFAWTDAGSRNMISPAPGDPGWPSMDKLPQIYAQLGIDFAKTKANIEANGWHGGVLNSEIVMLPGGGSPSVPAPAANLVIQTAGSVVGQTKGMVKDALVQTINAAKDALQQTGNAAEKAGDTADTLKKYVPIGLGVIGVIMLMNRKK